MNSEVTDGVLIGNLSFRTTSKVIATDAITLKTSETEFPNKGIVVMANDYDYYEDVDAEKPKLFRFTQQLISANPKLSDLTTDLADIPDFDRNKFEYTIQVPAHKTSITVFATPEDETSVSTINGEIIDKENGLEVPLEGFTQLVNTQDIEVLVTAEDGKSTQTYTITVEKLGGFVQGTVLTVNIINKVGIHNSTIKVYRSDQEINWKTTSSIALDEYELVNEINTQETGFFEIILPVGTFDILIDKPGYLDYIIQDVEVYQQRATSIGTKQIMPGDVDKDGMVKSTDQNKFLQAYNSKKGEELYDIKFDYIEDNIVKGTDQNKFLQYYNKKKTIE